MTWLRLENIVQFTVSGRTGSLSIPARSVISRSRITIPSAGWHAGKKGCVIMSKDNPFIFVFNTQPEVEDIILELQKAGFDKWAKIIRAIVSIK